MWQVLQDCRAEGGTDPRLTDRPRPLKADRIFLAWFAASLTEQNVYLDNNNPESPVRQTCLIQAQIIGREEILP